MPPTPPATDAPLLEFPVPSSITQPATILKFAPPPPGRTFAGIPKDPVTGREHTALYDIANGRTIDLGPGSTGGFSPDSRHMTWATWDPDKPTWSSPDLVWVIDLYTLEKRFLGEGRQPAFWNNTTVRVNVQHPTRVNQTQTILIDIETGARELSDGRKDSLPVPDFRYNARLKDADLQSTTRPSEISDELVVREKGSQRPLFRFKAQDVTVIDPDTLLITIGGTPTTEPGPTSWKEYHIYLVTISTHEVTYVTTMQPCRQLTANADYVAWTSGDMISPYKLFLYDRRTGAVLQLNESFFPVFAANGMLGHGLVGIERLVDLSTFQYHAVLPEEPFFTNWSPDFKFASAGYTGAHGTGC